MTTPNDYIDKRIIADLEYARQRNAAGDNPNLHKPRMVYDFTRGKVRIGEAA